MGTIFAAFTTALILLVAPISYTPQYELAHVIPNLDIPMIEDVTPDEADIFINAKKIDSYFALRDMPLAGYGDEMVRESNKNGLDWRLLPAIAIQESTGGKHACGFNPFGWGSCRIDFSSFSESIHIVARNLGGNNPRTSVYYKGDTRSKLESYNKTSTYPDEVISIMNKISKQP